MSAVSLVSINKRDLFEAGPLPKQYGRLSPCFRWEAGATGKDTRGFYRVHQCTKIEQMVFCIPDEEASSPLVRRFRRG